MNRLWTILRNKFRRTFEPALCSTDAIILKRDDCCSDKIFFENLCQWLSEEERMVDALALRADERRDKLRKASGSRK